jgi:hypothetical protein
MASYTTAMLSADMDFALNDFQVTLTVISPASSADVEFTATKRALQDAFAVQENGREVTLDTRFYLNINGVSTYPKKGWVVSDGTNSFKVESTFIGHGNVSLTLDCVSRYSRGR